MKTTIEFLDAVMKKHGIKSDNQLSAFIGCTRSAISGYRHKKTFLDDHIVLRVADALEIDPAYVMACVHAERAKHEPEKAVWERLATLSMGVAAAVLVAIALPFTSADDMQYGLIALSTASSSGPLYIMSNDGNKRKGSQEYCEPFAFWWAVLGSNQ